MMQISQSEHVSDCSPTTLVKTGSRKITKGGIESASVPLIGNTDNQQLIHFDRQRLHRLLRLADFRITRIALNCGLYFRLPLRRLALISGAGLAGLAISLILRKRGYKVVLAEKRDQFSRSNVISVNVEAQVLLKRFGLLKEFERSVAARIKEHQLVILGKNAVQRSVSDVQEVQLDPSIPFEPKSYPKLFVQSGIYSVPIRALQTLLAKKALEMGVHILGKVSVDILSRTPTGGVSEVQIRGIDTLNSPKNLHPDLFFIAEGAHSTTVEKLGMRTRVVQDECMGESWIFGSIAYSGDKTYSVAVIDASTPRLQIANAIFNSRSRVINVAVTSDRELSPSGIRERLCRTAQRVLDLEGIQTTLQLISAVQQPVHVINHTAVDFSADNVFRIGDAAGNYSPLAGLGGTLALTLVPSTVERLLDDRDQQSEKLHDRFRESSTAYTARWNKKSQSIKKRCLSAFNKEQRAAKTEAGRAPTSVKKVRESKKETSPRNRLKLTLKETVHGD